MRTSVRGAGFEPRVATLSEWCSDLGPRGLPRCRWYLPQRFRPSGPFFELSPFAGPRLAWWAPGCASPYRKPRSSLFCSRLVKFPYALHNGSSSLGFHGTGKPQGAALVLVLPAALLSLLEEVR